MLQAAQELFAVRGFAETRTREVAERAGVTEQLLFNHFGSKQQLFVAAVLNPFEDFVSAYLEAWGTVSPADADPELMLREYVEGLYRLAMENRLLFLALGDDRYGVPARGILDRLETLAADVMALHPFRFDAAIAVRLLYVATTTIALHQHDLLPNRSTEQIIDELAATVVTGLLGRT